MISGAQLVEFSRRKLREYYDRDLGPEEIVIDLGLEVEAVRQLAHDHAPQAIEMLVLAGASRETSWGAGFCGGFALGYAAAKEGLE